jgi:hypothetical protein
MRRQYRYVAAGFLVCVGVLFHAGYAMAGEKEVNRQLREAQKLYFRGDIQQADTLLKSAEAQAEMILQGNDTKEKQKINRLDAKMKKLRGDIDRKQGAAKAVPAKAAASGAGTGGNKGDLPSHVVSKIKSIRAQLDNAQGFIDKGALNSAKRVMENTRPLLDRLEKSSGKYLGPDHPEMIQLKERFSAIEAAVSKMEEKKSQNEASRAEEKTRFEAASQEWMERLKPYAVGLGQPGHDPERYFVGSYTTEEKEMARRTGNYEKVKALLAEWKRSGLDDDGASDELKGTVRSLAYQIKTFEDSCAMMAGTFLAEAQKKIGLLKPRIEGELKKIGSAEMPSVMHQNAFEDIRRSLDSATGLLGKDDSRVTAMAASYDDLVAKNGKLAEARIADTRMLTEKFAGAQKSDIRNKAEEILNARYAGIQLLRTNVISDDWKEESIIEWTDTTRSALRHRVTRSVTAQVAGKLNGATKVYTLFIGKERLTTGGWSRLQGHVMFVDPILEENVCK